MAPVHCAIDMHARLNDSRLVVISGVGHSPMVESPDEFSQAVLGFTRR